MLQTGFGFMEIMVIAAALLMLFGPKGMSGLIKDLARVVARLKRYRDEFTKELMSISDEVQKETKIDNIFNEAYNESTNFGEEEYCKENKRDLRNKFRFIRDDLKKNNVNDFSNRIYSFIESQNRFINAKKVFCYISVKNEVSTKKIIEECLREKKQVYVPWCASETEIKIVEIKDIEKDLEPGKLGIPEPIEELRNEIVLASEMDLFIIPGVVFDTECNRIGQGRGYFDRFLSKIKSVKPIWALAFNCQISEKPFSPSVSEEDIKPDLIITESRRIRDISSSTS